MEEDKITRFHFDFGGIELELKGEKEFVKSMYKEVLRDVERARAAVEEAAQEQKPSEKGKSIPREHTLWIHRASDMMRKIYVVAQSEFDGSPLGECLDSNSVKSVFIEKTVFPDFFPDLDKGQTLWAEFTQEGREKITEATEPMRKALREDLLSKKK